MPRPATGRTPAAVLLALLLCLTAGCSSGKKLPTMYPVGGKVVYKTGGPMTGGSVNFQSQSDPTITTSGEIQPDGTFSLTTFADKQLGKGAPPGEYRATIIPVMGADRSVQPISIAKPFKVEAKENQFAITLDRAAPKK